MLLSQIVEAHHLTPEFKGGWMARIIGLLKDNKNEQTDLLADMLDSAVKQHADIDPTKLLSFLRPLIDAQHDFNGSFQQHTFAEAVRELLQRVVGAINHAKDDALAAELLKRIKPDELRNYISREALVQLQLTQQKLGRDKEQIDFDQENDKFIFIGRPVFKEVPEGSGNFKKTLEIENLVKVDGYDAKSHAMASMMKLRARVQGENSEVYRVALPAGLTKGGHDLPDWLVALIDEHKRVLT